MIIKNWQIKKLKEIYKQKKHIDEVISENKKTLQDRHGEREIEIEREGKKIKIQEKVLWQELFYGGLQSQAGKILFEKYPEMKEYSDKQIALNDKLNLFTLKNWGFYFADMDLVRFIDITLALIRYQILRFFFLDKLIINYKKWFTKKK